MVFLSSLYHQQSARTAKGATPIRGARGTGLGAKGATFKKWQRANRCRILFDEIANTNLFGTLGKIACERVIFTNLPAGGDNILSMKGDAASGKRVSTGVWMLIRNDRSRQTVRGASRTKRPRRGPSIKWDGWVSPDSAKWEVG
jgi:hypothetical protein